MNTLRIEEILAKKYKYKPLPGDLSDKYRNYFAENIPEWLLTHDYNSPLYTLTGTKLCNSHGRIVVGDYGAFVEFYEEAPETEFVIKSGQEYRVNDPKYIDHVKYIWLTVLDNSGVKIYKQKRTVRYADYLPGCYYVSVHQVSERGIENARSETNS